jgi:hypothetical protein
MAKVVLRDVRLSFPDLFEAQQFEGTGPYYYRATFLFPEKSDNYKKVMEAIEEVAKEKWAAKAPGILKAALATPNKTCLVDGDTKDYNGFAGNWALSAARNQDAGPPRIVDRAKNPLVAADGKLYGGAYVNATVELWAQDNKYGKAIRATLVNVQFVKDGESFGGAAPATDADLDDLGYDDDEDGI